MYEFTNDGQCFSNGKKLKGSLNTKGYLFIATYLNGERTVKLVHREVAKQFIPNPLNLPQVNHLDGDKTNNHYTNLEWCDAKANNKHARDNGLNLLDGEDNGNSKLSNEEVLSIRASYPMKSSRQLGKEYGVSKTLIMNIVKRKTWTHI